MSLTRAQCRRWQTGTRHIVAAALMRHQPQEAMEEAPGFLHATAFPPSDVLEARRQPLADAAPGYCARLQLAREYKRKGNRAYTEVAVYSSMPCWDG
jgi:hypothetical protein